MESNGTEKIGLVTPTPDQALIIKTKFPYTRTHIMKIRRSHDRLIFIMGTPSLIRWHFPSKKKKPTIFNIYYKNSDGTERYFTIIKNKRQSKPYTINAKIDNYMLTELWKKIILSGTTEMEVAQTAPVVIEEI